MAGRAVSLILLTLVGASALLCSRHAAAQNTPRVHLSWVRDAAAAEACPDVAQMQHDVAGRLGYSPFVSGDRDSASIEVLVTRSKSAWQAVVVMRGADGALRGNRRVDSAAPECGSLAAAAGLAIALMIDPEVIIRPPPVKTAPKPAPAEKEPLRPVAAPAPRPGPRGALALGAQGALGVLPSPTLGPLLRGELELRRGVALVVAAQFFPEQNVVHAGAEAWLGLSLASVGPCYRIELGKHWAVASCGSFLAGSLHLGVASPEVVDAGPRPWFALSCGLRVSLRAGTFELTLGGDGLAHLARHNYSVSRQNPPRSESLFTEPAAGALGSLATGVRF
ncbi:MAG TPA: hypothetical protein VHP33_33460 [Polyangiaceae bacterium]|nr:hypothetical protein [Polyangiaceae bacterium]